MKRSQAVMKRFLFVFISMQILFASQAQALFDVEAFVGTASFTTNSDNAKKISGNQVAVSAHLDPIPLVPVGFGLHIGVPGGTATETADGIEIKSKIAGLSVDLELMAWSPVALLGLTPYVKLGATVYGKAAWDMDLTTPTTVAGQDVTIKGKNVYDFSATGSSFALGIQYSLIPFVALMLEYRSQSQKWKANKVKSTLGDVDVDISTSDIDDVTTKISSLLLGVSVGL